MARRFGVVAAAAAVAVALAAGTAEARVKLTTLPVRERVEIQLDNASATLVEEERIVTLLEGGNEVDFSWSNTAIDKGTIQFRVVGVPTRPKAANDPASLVRPDGQVETVRVISVAYPPGENSLVWQVYSEKAYAARVRISYVIGNLSRGFDYRAVGTNDEKTLTLRNYIRLDNFSGEDFGGSGVWAGFGNYFQREIGANEAKQMLAWKFAEVPVKKTFTFDWYTGQPVPNEPEQRYVSMRYVLANDKDHKMGLFPLQPGKVRIFQEDAHGGEAFIGEDWGQFTPIDDEMKLYLGLARDVVVKRRIARNERKVVANDVYDQDVVIEYEIENFKTDAVTLDVAEDLYRVRDDLCGGKDHFPQWEVVPEDTTIAADAIETKDARTVELHIPLAAAPAGAAKVEALTAKVHLRFRNEW